MSRSKKPLTILAHGGSKPWDNRGIVNPPVYHASTILFEDLDALKAASAGALNPDPEVLSYGRTGTPTSIAFEQAVAELEGAYGTVSAPSGLAAITTALMAFVKTGDHVLVADTAYSPTRRFSQTVLKRMGVEVEFYDPLIGAGIAEKFRPNTVLLYMESPGSLTFEIQDVPAMVDAARKANIPTAIDNTWASPFFCRPIELGVDVSIQAATKYIVGHSDVMMGTISMGSKEMYEKVKMTAITFGVGAGPDDLYLALRGFRTMGVRLARHQDNALEVATWLQGRPEVTEVLYPALPSHPGHAIWKRDFSGASGLFSVVLKPAPDEAFAALIEGLELFPMGASWGGYESLSLPASPQGLRTATEWTEQGKVLRLHVGLEDVSDMIADLEAGLDRFNKAANA